MYQLENKTYASCGTIAAIVSWVLFFSHVSYLKENDVIILNNIQGLFQ
ncbi:hypothetical protein MHB84_28425 [Paenibacillus sp. FSL F4-0087]